MVAPDYRLILDTLSEPVVVGDRAGRIVYANPAAESLLEWPRDALLGQPLTVLIPNHLRARHTSGFNRYRSTWSSRVLGRGIRVAALRRSGREVRVELTITAYRGRGGDELYMACLRPLSRHAPGAERGGSGAAVAVEEGAWLKIEGFREAMTIEQLARRLIGLSVRGFQASLVQLWICDPDAPVLRLAKPSLEPAAAWRKPASIDPRSDPGPVALAARSRNVATAVGSGQLQPPDEGSDDPALSLAAVPLVHGGELFGVLACGGDTSLSESQLHMLCEVAVLSAGVLHAAWSSRLRQARDRNRSALLIIQAASAALANGHPIRETLSGALRDVLALLGFDGALLLRPEPAGWRVWADSGYRPSLEDRVLPPSRSFDARLEGPGAARVEDFLELDDGFPALRQRGARAVLIAPVSFAGERRGALLLETRKSDRRITSEDEIVIETLAAQTALAWELEFRRST